MEAAGDQSLCFGHQRFGVIVGGNTLAIALSKHIEIKDDLRIDVKLRSSELNELLNQLINHVIIYLIWGLVWGGVWLGGLSADAEYALRVLRLRTLSAPGTPSECSEYAL